VATLLLSISFFSSLTAWSRMTLLVFLACLVSELVLEDARGGVKPLLFLESLAPAG
jgi:hypothetical protein